MSSLAISLTAFFALAAYVAVDAVRALWVQQAPEHSPVGIGLAVVSLLVMPLLQTSLVDVLGDAELVRDTVRAYADAGVDVPVLMPLPWGEDRLGVVRDTMAAAADA